MINTTSGKNQGALIIINELLSRTISKQKHRKAFFGSDFSVLILYVCLCVSLLTAQLHN